jgi:internalin A
VKRKQHECYVSWGDLTAQGKERDEFVDLLCAAARQRGIRILRDKTALGVGESISNFMRRIGRGDRVFVVLGNEYLRSPYCMFELFEVWRNSRVDPHAFVERVRAYTLPGTKILTTLDRLEHAIYGKEQFEALEAVAKSHGLGILGENDVRQFKMMQDFASRVSEILATVADVLQPRGFDALEQHLLNDLEKSA